MDAPASDTHSENGTPLWPLPASLDLTGAEPLHHALKDLLIEGAIHLDGAAVERVSTPALQVLAAAARAARGRNIPFTLSDASGVLSNAIADLGLDSLIPEAC